MTPFDDKEKKQTNSENPSNDKRKKHETGFDSEEDNGRKKSKKQKNSSDSDEKDHIGKKKKKKQKIIWIVDEHYNKENLQTLYEKKFIDPLWEPFILVLHASLANVKQCSYSTPYYKQIDGTIRPNFLGSLYACIMMEMNNLTKQGNCDGVAKLPLSCLISNLQQVFMFTSERIDMVERKLIKEGCRTGFLKRFQEHSPLTCCDVIDKILYGTPQQSMTNEKFARKLRKKIAIEDLTKFKFEEELKISNILCKALKEMGKPMCVRVNEISFGIEAQLDDSEKKYLEKMVLDTIGYKNNT